MLKNLEKILITTTKIDVPSSLEKEFIDWQTKLHSIIATFPGFVSLEILSPTEASSHAWLIVQRFSQPKWLSHWHHSKKRLSLMNDLNKLLGDEHQWSDIQDMESEASQLPGIVTEVFVTQVAPGKEEAYREWIAKIHQAEAKFPGFRGVYVQSPSQKGRHWITLLQFDSLENLDHWLTSSEREKVLQESASLVSNLESHRIMSSYAGWFASIVKKEGEIPPVWKQTMIVLLVLFPIVMFEIKYLSPLTASLNSSLATFIGNAISVTLIAWPFMPIAIWFLGWWLSPKGMLSTLWGTGGILLLYLIEIALFWVFL